jgi:hypothetical protein
MAAIAEALKHMLAAGMDHDAIVAAVADMESAATPSQPARTARQERNARYYQTKVRLKSSERRLKASETSYSDASHPNDGNPSSSTVEFNLNPEEPSKKTPTGSKKVPNAHLAEPFERFRRSYPRRNGTDGRQESFAAFAKAVRCGADPEKLAAAAAAFARSEEGQRAEFVPMSATWLNKGRWREWAEIAAKKLDAADRREKSAEPSPATWDERKWRQAISYSRVVGWNKNDLGPPPGDPGCLAPPSLLKPDDYQHRSAA